jgi:threonylcarbamoyladenosine tRNA methylthiotransferase MtaB
MLAANNKKLMPHFHIPLQSGSNAMLKLMKRKYDTELFKSRIEMIRKYIPDAFIGIDLIVGVNGETNEMFEESLSFISSLDINYIHHFQYSERENTQALKYNPKINTTQKEDRANIIKQLCANKHTAFLQKAIGQEFEVLFENQKKNADVCGYTDNYIRICSKSNQEVENKILKVKAVSFKDNETLYGEIL